VSKISVQRIFSLLSDHPNIEQYVNLSDYRITDYGFLISLREKSEQKRHGNAAEMLVLDSTTGQRAGETLQKASEVGPPAVEVYRIRKRQGSKQERLYTKQARWNSSSRGFPSTEEARQRAGELSSEHQRVLNDL
jgi:hypothetical protein